MEFKNIILPVTFERFLDEGSEPILILANKQKSDVTLLCTLDYIPDSNLINLNLEKADLISHLEKLAHSHLIAEGEKINIKYQDININFKVIIGIPFIKISEIADTNSSDLIAIDASYGNCQKRIRLSSVTKHLMRKSKTPIWMIAKRENSEMKHIVAAVDVVTDSPEGKELNIKIIENSLHIAKNLNAKLTVLHAWKLYGEGYLQGWGRKTSFEIAMMAKEEKEHRTQLMLDLIDKIPSKGNVAINIILNEGPSDVVIPDYVFQTKADLLVMGTVCRTGLPGFFIGNTAENVLDIVPCSVIALKPDGFLSPLQVKGKT